jgi:hypothetical protein
VEGSVGGVVVVPTVGGGGKGGSEVVCALERGVCEEGGELRRGEQYETYRISRLYINTLINGQWKQSAEDGRTL